MSSSLSRRPDDDRLSAWVGGRAKTFVADEAAPSRNAEQAPEPKASVFKGFLIAAVISCGLWGAIYAMIRLIFG